MKGPIPRGAHLRPTLAEPVSHAPNAALLIDFDNVTMGIRSDLQNQLRGLLNSEIIKGKVAVQRAYADWRRYPQYIVPLSEASIDLIFAPAFGSNKKNATDIRLAIDALEIVFTRPEIGTFILLSGDSDFSSLVLKLKEYGKYVIGVGLRESSSDLLVQNCDEYYAYTELMGLQREGDVDHPRRDPWELVVEAVTLMKKEDDVMRSDRLKQVMQTLDPNFDEKDAGFSRFSKFVQEAAQRGLIETTKMENGQFAIDLGKNANVSPEDEAALRGSAAPKRDRAPRGQRRERRAAPTGERQGLTLAESFELLRQALLVLEAIGERASEADEVRDKMAELLGDDADPVFDRGRFQRMLRQAHDAELIELVKDNGAYRLKLRPEALVVEAEAEVAAAGEEVEDGAEPAAGAAGAAGGDAEAGEPEAGRGSRGRGRRAAKGRSKSTRGRRRKEPEAELIDTRVEARADAANEAPVGRPIEAVARAPEQPRADARAAAESRRNPRYRRGSRGGSPPPKASAVEVSVEQPPAPPATASAHSARSLGPRLGSRRGTGGAPGSPPPVPSEPASAASAPTRREQPEPRVREERPAARHAEPAPKRDEQADASAPGGGLLARMSAAFQKAFKPHEGDEHDEA